MREEFNSRREACYLCSRCKYVFVLMHRDLKFIFLLLVGVLNTSVCSDLYLVVSWRSCIIHISGKKYNMLFQDGFDFCSAV